MGGCYSNSNVARWPRVRLGVALGLLALACPQLARDDFTTVRGPDAGQTAIDCAPFERCGEACVDLASNPSHCGECGAALEEDQICSMGNGISARTGCGLMQTLCNRGCVDTEAHPFFCGACDVHCKPGARCMMGNCMCAPPAAKDCGDACRQCCGDADCPMDKVCSAGVCELQCSSEQAECGDRCVDLATDPRNCGECRNDCGRDRVCSAGTCR